MCEVTYLLAGIIEEIDHGFAIISLDYELLLLQLLFEVNSDSKLPEC